MNNMKLIMENWNRYVNEDILNEEVFGAQAFLYHGSNTPPKEFIKILLNNEFNPGGAAGAMYGKGLYTVYDLNKTATSSGNYGQYIYKIKANISDLLSFDPEITKKIYGSDLTPAQQAKKLGLNNKYIVALEKNHETHKQANTGFSSDEAFEASRVLKGKIKGLIFTGRTDGTVAIIFDPSIVVPIAWKKVDEQQWTKIDPNLLKKSGALGRSSLATWQKGKYDRSPFEILNQLSTLPPEKRIYSGNLELNYIAQEEKLGIHIPEFLKVKGDFTIRTDSKKPFILPRGLEVDGLAFFSHLPVTKVSEGTKINGSLNLGDTLVASLPDNLYVEDRLTLRNAPITTLPRGLKVGELDVRQTKIVQLPDDLVVTSEILANPEILPKLQAQYEQNKNKRPKKSWWSRLLGREE